MLDSDEERAREEVETSNVKENKELVRFFRDDIMDGKPQGALDDGYSTENLNHIELELRLQYLPQNMVNDL